MQELCLVPGRSKMQVDFQRRFWNIYSSWESPDKLSHLVAVEPGGTEHPDLISVPHTQHHRSQEKWDSNEPECKVRQPLPNL